MDTGIDVSKLQEGTKITIETKNSIYEIVVLKNKQIKVMGGILPNGDYRFSTPTDATFMGSSLDADLTENWIDKHMKLEIIYDNKVFVSSAIVSAELEAPDLSWHYVMDW